MHRVGRWLAPLALVVAGGCGGGMRMYGPRCEARYEACTDACAPRCEPTGPEDDNMREAGAFNDAGDLSYADCNGCVQQCKQAAEKCEAESPVQDESPFHSPPEGEPPSEAPSAAP